MSGLDIKRVCRICLAEGSRNIFSCAPTTTQPGAGGCNNSGRISSLENLVEKLRYVTMAQIKENDYLPKMICDLCIVQLNVSYGFKRLANENDSKIRQYIIEKGLEPLAITYEPQPPPSTQTLPTSIYYSSNISFTQNSSTSIFPKPLPMPVCAIKQEPVDLLVAEEVEEEEPITLDYEDSDVSVSPETVIVTNKSPSTTNRPSSNVTKTFSNNLMVVVNDDSLLSNSSKPGNNETSSPTKRDLEFVNNYMQRRTKTTPTSTKCRSTVVQETINKEPLQFTDKPRDLNTSNPTPVLDNIIPRTIDLLNAEIPREEVQKKVYKKNRELLKLLADQKKSNIKELTTTEELKLRNRLRNLKPNETKHKVKKNKGKHFWQTKQKTIQNREKSRPHRKTVSQ